MSRLSNEEIKEHIKQKKHKLKGKKSKQKKLLTVVISLLAINLIAISAIMLTRDLKLKGDAEMYVNIGEEFKDPGTNMHSKVSGKVDVKTPGD